jgi:hypothetical protein
MATLTVAEKIQIAKICQYRDANNIAKNGTFSNGSTDYRLPLMLYTERMSVEWLYDLDPTNDTLLNTSNYLLSLCKEQLKAQAIINAGGGGIPVTPVVSITEPIQFIVGSGGQYVPNNGDSAYNNPELAGNNRYIITSNSDGGDLIAGTDFDYLSTGGFEWLNGRVFYTAERFTLFFY